MQVVIRRTGSKQETIKEIPDPRRRGLTIGRDPEADVVLDGEGIPKSCLSLVPSGDVLLVMEMRSLEDVRSGLGFRCTPLTINGRALRNASLLDDYIGGTGATKCPGAGPRDPPPWQLRSGDVLQVGPFEVRLSWKGPLSRPFAIERVWLPRNRSSTGRYIMFQIKPPGRGGGSLDLSVLAVRESARSSTWKAAAAVRTAFDCPSPVLLDFQERPDCLVVYHGYGLLWSLDGGRTLLALNGWHFKAMHVGKLIGFGHRWIVDVTLEETSLIVHTSNPMRDRRRELWQIPLRGGAPPRPCDGRLDSGGEPIDEEIAKDIDEDIDEEIDEENGREDRRETLRVEQDGRRLMALDETDCWYEVSLASFANAFLADEGMIL